MNDLKGLSVIVSGGASGLGAATAKVMAASGAKVTLFDMNDEKGEQTAKDIDALYCHVNVTNEDNVQKGIDVAVANHGDLRALVNCAGIVTGEKTTSRGKAHSLESFSKVIQVNLIGSFNCARLAATQMTSQEPMISGDRGVIVNTASIAAYDGQVGQSAYAASKGGIAGLTLPMARDLSRDQIRVVTIAPGTFMTPMMEGMPQEILNSLGAAVPYPSRLGDPAEFANLAQHAIENTYLNGEVIRLDGALRMAPK